MTHMALGDLSLGRLRLVDSNGDAAWVHALAGRPTLDLPPPHSVICPVIGVFVRLWADAAPSEDARAHALAFLSLPSPGIHPSTKVIEVERMMLVGEWGRRRLAMLIELAGDCEEALAIVGAAERVDRTARRTYGIGSPLAEMAAGLAPPIESPVIPDVAAALRSHFKRTGSIKETRAAFERVSAKSVDEAESLVREMWRRQVIYETRTIS